MELRVDGNSNPIVDQFSEEGFIDLVFRIHDLKDTGDHYRFHMAASHEGRLLGLNVEISKGMGPGFDQDMQLLKDHVYRGGVRFYRSGENSDALLATIAKLYGLDLKVNQMVECASPPLSCNKAK